MSNSAILDRCENGAASAPLTAAQRRELVLLARRAFLRLYDAGQISETTEFDAWRHQQAKIAVERDGIRACRQEDFAQLKGYLLRLLGAERQADRMQARAEMEPRRIAEWKLDEECWKAQDVISRPHEYVFSIARARYKAGSLADLTVRQLWVLMFDLRRNAQRRRAKRRAA